MRMPSVMKKDFSVTPSLHMSRSSFDRSSGHTTAFNGNKLIPFYTEMAYPGDTINLRTAMFARLATPRHPFLDNLRATTHFWFVPLRLLQANFKRLMGEQDTPDASTDYLTPIVNAPAGGFDFETMFDYFGIPPKIANTWMTAYEARAYNFIWNTKYRDENLQNPVPFNTNDGPDAVTDYTLLPRGKRYDYFTSCLPFPQKGPAVPLPLTGNAPVKSTLNMTGASYNVTNAGVTTALRAATGGAPVANSEFYADMTAVAAATVNQLRQVMQIQSYYEINARAGTRFPELTYGQFGVVNDDRSLSLPEYLGGSTTAINVNPIAQTSSTDATSPQGNLAAMGTLAFDDGRHGFTKSFTEWGVVIGLISVSADLRYQQGIERRFSTRTKFDFFWPVFSQLGEQGVKNREIYAQGTSADDLIFGYQEFGAHLRYRQSIITGKMRSTHPQSLDVWHLAQKFAGLPVLNNAFIIDNPPVDRVIATVDEPWFLCEFYFHQIHTRVMPKFGIPAMLGRL